MDLTGPEIRDRQRKALENVIGTLLKELEPRDVVPALLARTVLKSGDMSLIYSKVSCIL